MSHEIRTPINAILGMNEMILRESTEASTLTYSQNIKTAGNTLLGIVNDILDFSKIEEGKMNIVPVDYDLLATLKDLVNMIRIKLDAKKLKLILDFDNNTPRFLHGDEIRIKQIITNILTNSAKYTERGNVTFRVSYEKKASEPDSVMLNITRFFPRFHMTDKDPTPVAKILKLVEIAKQNLEYVFPGNI